MYSLHLVCRHEELERICLDLWEMGTAGIREQDQGDKVLLIAAFEDTADRDALANHFSAQQPLWEREADIDWIAATELSWPPRTVGSRLFLSPIWNQQATPKGLLRIIHNPGMASGTGEHPCTQLALEQLERCVTPGSLMVDVGTGSGILSIAALKLGAAAAIALDTDEKALTTAQENFLLNGFAATIAAGSADCIASDIADVVVANISGTVLLSLADDLMRIVRPGGWLILTGFPESEVRILQQAFAPGDVTAMDEWRCLTLRL